MRSFSHHSYTWRDYLAFERTSNSKHEFLEGEIFAMAGGTPQHSALGLALGSELRAQLKGKPCRAYNSDLRIRILETGLGTYPDVSVVCGEPQYDPDDSNTVVNPVVLVEVLSESTESYDRGEKFEHYKRSPSLKEHVLVSTREKLIEVWRRGPAPDWTRAEARTHAAVRLESIGCVLEVDAVYADILER